MEQGQSRSVRVAIAGVGNCASSLVQAATAARAGVLGPGLAHPRLAGYEVGDIEFVAAFDVDDRKIGQDLSAAISSAPNCTTNYIEVPLLGVEVACGPLLDGVGAQTSDVVEVAAPARQATFDQVTAVLEQSRADVLINYLPVGSAKATAGYAGAALAAGVAFVNCNSEVIATDPEWQRQFAARGVPLLGDDIKSQLGATTLHRTLIEMCTARGAVIDRTYQLNVGGNTDFRNLLDPTRAASNRASRMASLQSRLDSETEVGAGSSDFVPHLKDRKVAYLTLEGRSMLGMTFAIEVKLEVEDSPNAAGVAVDAVRLAKIAADRNLGGPVSDVCAPLFTAPPIPYADAEAAEELARFVDEN